MAKLNAEVDTVTAARYRVESYPTILVLKPDGTEIDRLAGYYRAPEFIGLVDDYLAGRNTLASLIAAESTLGQDPRFVARLADRYFEHGLYPEARSRYERMLHLDPKNQTDLVDDALTSLARLGRKSKDYPTERKYAQMVLDRFPESDQAKTALLQLADSYKRQESWTRAHEVYLDYTKKYPGDEDTPWAKEQADTMSARAERTLGKRGA
jgi:tetratricopeptide (TPR) repeat protein